MDINIYYGENTKIDLETNEGLKKVAALIKENAGALALIQAQLNNLEKIPLVGGVKMGRWQSQTLYFAEPIIFTYAHIPEHPSAKGIFEATGVVVTASRYYLAYEPETDLSLISETDKPGFTVGFKTEDVSQDQDRVEGIEFNTLLWNSNKIDNPKTVDPIQLVVETRPCTDVFTVTVMNKYDQVVGTVEVANVDGKVQVLIWDTESVVDGASPSAIVNPEITFDKVLDGPHQDISTNPSL